MQANFLRTTAPALPPHRGSTKALVGGTVQDVWGMALLTPEINASDLTAGESGLLKLYEQASAGSTGQRKAVLSGHCVCCACCSTPTPAGPLCFTRYAAPPALPARHAEGGAGAAR